MLTGSLPLTSRRRMKPIKRAYDIRIHKIDTYKFDQTVLEISWREWESPAPSFVVDIEKPPSPAYFFQTESKNFAVTIANEFLYVATPFDLEKMLYMVFDPVFQMDIPELNSHLHTWIKKSAYELEGYQKYVPELQQAKNDYRLSVWSQELPGVNELVKNPMTDVLSPLREVIINLNDRHKWTREKIADWIETLDIDTRFKVD